MLNGVGGAFEGLNDPPWAGKLLLELADASLGGIRSCGTSGKNNVAGQIDYGVGATGIDECLVPFALLQNE